MLNRAAVRSGALAGALLWFVPASGVAQELEDRMPMPDKSGETALVRFLARPDEFHSRFRVRRQMWAEGLGRRAYMEVRVEVDPESGFRFQVEAEDGSRLFLDRIFRASLAKEGEMHAQGTVARAALTRENYIFSPLGARDDGHARLRALPRRAEANLLDGLVVVTADSSDLVRAEGRLARSPSFWVPRVEVVRHFRRLQGHRVVVRIESLAHVRLLGAVCVVMDFAYEMVDGEDIAAGPRGPRGQGGSVREEGERAACRALDFDKGDVSSSRRTLAAGAEEPGTSTAVP